MKISYHDPRPSQSPVSPAQEEMRQTRPRGLPVLRAFFILLLLGILGFIASRAWLHNQLFAFGVLASRTDEIRTPWQATVRGLHLRPGDRVRQGELLCQLVPLEAESQARSLQAYAAALGSVPASPSTTDTPVLLTSSQDAPTSAPLAAPTEADLACAGALARLQTAQAEFEQAAQRRRYDIEKATIEHRKLQTHYSARQARYERVRKLHELDAAVASDVQTARLEMELAKASLDQAALDLRAARQAINPFAAQVELARRQLQAAEARRQAERRERRAILATASQDLGVELSPELPLDPARLGISAGAPVRAPLAIRAPYDGVAYEVATSDGRALGADQAVLSLAETGNTWVDAFVAPDKSDRLKPGQRVRVYVGGRTKPRAGTIASISGLATDVPAVLAAQMPETRRAIYCRVELNPGPPVAPGQIVKIVME